MLRPLIYLTAILAAPLFAQDLPEAPGKAVVARICSGCHGVEMFAGAHRGEADWDRTIANMTEKGLSIRDEDYAVVLDYLTKNLGPVPKAKPAAPAPAATPMPAPTAREIFKQLIEINTT